MLAEFERVLVLNRVIGEGGWVQCVRCSDEKGCRVWHFRRYHRPVAATEEADDE